MPGPVRISASTRKGVRAVALMVVLCLLCAVGWSAADSLGHGDGIVSAATDPAAKAPAGAGSDSRDGNPPPGKFYLPRQTFIEVSRPALRDPQVPQPAPLVPVPPAFTVEWKRLAPSGTVHIKVPAEDVGRATPRIPTGPPASA